MTSLVLFAAAWCVALLAAEVVVTLSRGRPRVRAVPRGPAWRGAAYLFGPGMNPRAKDGARRHPLVLAGGVAYHAAIGVALLLTVFILTGVRLTAVVHGAMAVVLVAGAAAGAGLAARRARSEALRRISVPDDFVSNGLVTVVLAAGAAADFSPRLEPVFLLAVSALLLYAPLGKIRHCVFYPLARLSLGLMLGRRGVYGAPSRSAGA
jgi:hypothetical protein